MELTKKYRIVYDEDNKVILSGEFNDGSKTVVGKGENGKEFDMQQELDNFIENNGLIVEEDK